MTVAAQPEIEVHVAVAPTPAFCARLHLLAESLRAYGGLGGRARVIATVSRECEPFDLAAQQPWSREHGVEWRWVREEPYRRWGLAATALERLRYRFEAPFVVILDADTMCTGRLQGLPDLVGEAFAGAIAHISPAGSFAYRDGRSRDGEVFWRDLFASAGLEPPALECAHSGWGLIDHAPDRRLCPPYFNLGVLAGSAETVSAAGRVAYEELANVERFGESVFRCQLALALAVARLGLPWTELPLRYNFPNDRRIWETNPSEAGDVRMLHYLRRDEVDRDDFLSDRGRLKAFLERTELSPANRLLQARVKPLAERVASSMPEWTPAPGGRPRYPFARPALPGLSELQPHLEPAYVQHRFSNRGPAARRLEREVSTMLELPEHSPTLVSSGTSGLAAALIAFGIDGRVAMPAFTFPATAEAAVLAGATPVFCDIDPETWELAPDEAARAVEERGCTAIVHVRSFGLCRNPAPIEAVARKAGVPLIVDSAAAFGGRDEDGVRVGGGGDAEVFSFHATKVMAVGEGGAIVASSRMANRVRRTINFGIADEDVVVSGLNAKMSEFTAGVGLAMLPRLDRHIEVRRGAVERFSTAAASGGATAPVSPGDPPWQCLPLLAPSTQRRDKVIDALAARGVECRKYYSPGLHRTAAFAGFADEPLPVTDDVAGRIICFPVYSEMTAVEIEELERELAAAVSGAGTHADRTGSAV